MSTTTPPEALRRIEKCRTTKNITLDLSRCELTEVPSELADLIWLENLNLSGNEISEIRNLDTITGLTVLNLTDNQISEIKNLDALTALTKLHISRNQISEIKNLDALTALTGLNLAGNQIREIKNFDALAALTTLGLYFNQISEIKNLDSLTGLTELYLFNNQVSEIKNLDALTGLTRLYLHSNQISEIKNLDMLTALTKLDISRNQISEIKNLDPLPDLTQLSLFGNQISEIENLDALTALTTLDISSNQISEIKNLDALTALTTLDISSNQISEIKNLDALAALMKLYLYSNQISEIRNLDALTALTKLHLSNNQISRLSSSLIPLFGRIEEIDLSKNPIEGTTITDWKSLNAILGYIQSLEDNQTPNYHLKVNIIGEGRIGKTQLLNYWEEKKKYKANAPETHGTLTTQFAIPGGNYKATIWDFGGQSYHHGFHHVFLRPNDFYLVLWRNDSAKKPDYGYWLGTARNFSRPNKKEYIAPVVLVQNVWTETDNTKKKEAHQADRLAFPDSRKMQKYGITLDDLFVIDVKNLHKGSPHWKTKHDYFERSLYQKMIAHAQNVLPEISEKWLAVKEKLDGAPNKIINLKKSEFKQLYAANFDEAALAGLLDYLEFTGNIIKFPEPSSLANYVFPNPPALSDWIYGTVLNKKLISESQGILVYKDLEKNIGKEQAMIFRKIMDEFSLLFTEKKNDDHLVIPQFLPESNNTFKRLLLELIPYSFCLRFEDYFHESRIFQFISEYGEYADDKSSYWRYGLVFTKNDINALVYYNVQARIIFVHLESKSGRIKIGQEIFDYFSHKPKAPQYIEKRFSYFARKYNIGISTLADFAREKGIEVKVDPNTYLSFEAHRAISRALQRQDWKKELRSFSLSSTPENVKRERPQSDDLMEGVQLSVNQKDYIDIKETLQNNTDNFPVGICVESRKRIKLDNLTLNLLGMVNQKLPKVFISYSRKDLEYKDELKTHLSILERYDLLKAWSCEEIEAGTWDSQIQTELEEADVIVYMVS